MSGEFVIREVNILKDAVKLAEMWRASDDQWPGTWSGGAEITPAMVAEQYERARMLNVYVVETPEGDKIVGYCGLNERQEERGVGYVDLLNVQPEYQGRSLARRLLQRCIDRCIELKFHLLTLETWPGNLKAVPLYKKVGFFWVPDTSVWMLNFMPAILALPCAQDYFSHHDWYRTFKRELTQEEDDERWEGMKVCTYHWEEGGEALTVWADREAWRITAVETDAFFAGAIAGNIEPPKGMPVMIHWRFVNKRSRPVTVSLVAMGTEHLELDVRATATVAPGATWELERPVQVSQSAPDVQERKPVPAVRTLFIVDGEVLELGTGLRPRPAIEVSTAPEYVTLSPGVTSVVSLQLHSYLREAVQAKVNITAAPGLRVTPSAQDVEVPARGWAGVPVELEATDDGVYPIYVTVAFREGTAAPRRLAIFCLGPGGVLADRGEKETRLENAGLRVLLKVHGGEVGLYTPESHTHLGSYRERLGPPFYPSEFDQREFDIEVRRAGSGFTAVATIDSEVYPGLQLRREVHLGSGPLVTVQHNLVNKGDAPHEVQLNHRMFTPSMERAVITVPLKDGLVQSRASDFPVADEDIPKQPDALSERWVAYDYDREGTFGVLWQPDVAEHRFTWAVSLVTTPLRCTPRQWTPGGRFFLYGGTGAWRAVREWARRLAGETETEPIPTTPRKVHGVTLVPSPLLSLTDQVSAELMVDNLRRRPLVGRVGLEVPPGVTIEPHAFDVEDAALGQPVRKAVALSLAPEPRAYALRAELTAQAFRDVFALPVIRLGSAGEVRVTDGEVWWIDNGRVRLAIAPDFSGAVVRWEERGTNHLLSPYPEKGAFSWISPWYGGITPVAFLGGDEDFPGKLDRELFTALVVRVEGVQGIPWHGVRLRAALQREQLCGLTVELDYLTVAGSNLLKLVYRVHNQTTARRRLSIGWATFWQPGGSSDYNTLHSADLNRRPNPWFAWTSAGHWVAVHNPQTGHAALLVSRYPKALAMDWGEAGNHMGWFSAVTVQPQATLTRSAYVVLCESLDAAKPYGALRELGEDPS